MNIISVNFKENGSYELVPFIKIHEKETFRPDGVIFSMNSNDLRHVAKKNRAYHAASEELYEIKKKNGNIPLKHPATMDTQDKERFEATYNHSFEEKMSQINVNKTKKEFEKHQYSKKKVVVETTVDENSNEVSVNFYNEMPDENKKEEANYHTVLLKDAGHFVGAFENYQIARRIAENKHGIYDDRESDSSHLHAIDLNKKMEAYIKKAEMTNEKEADNGLEM